VKVEEKIRFSYERCGAIYSKISSNEKVKLIDLEKLGEPEIISQ